MIVSELVKLLEDCNPDYTIVDFEFDEINLVEEDDETEEVRLS